jgi:hypothetical protein
MFHIEKVLRLFFQELSGALLNGTLSLSLSLTDKVRQGKRTR